MSITEGKEKSSALQLTQDEMMTQDKSKGVCLVFSWTNRQFKYYSGLIPYIITSMDISSSGFLVAFIGMYGSKEHENTKTGTLHIFCYFSKTVLQNKYIIHML